MTETLTMRAAVLHEPRTPLAVEEVLLDPPQADVDRGERHLLVPRADEGGLRRLARSRRGEGERGRRPPVRRRDGGGDDVREEMRVRVDAPREDDAAAGVDQPASSLARRDDGGDPPSLDEHVGLAHAIGRDDEASGDDRHAG